MSASLIFAIYFIGCAVAGYWTQLRFNARKEEIEAHPFLSDQIMKMSIAICSLLSWVSVVCYISTWMISKYRE